MINYNQGNIQKVIFTGICIGITMRQGYNTASKYMRSPMSTQVQEIALQGKYSESQIYEYIARAHEMSSWNLF